VILFEKHRKRLKGDAEMKKKGLMGLFIVSIMCLSFAGCEGTPVPPVDTAEDLAQLVENDMTLSQVYALMSPEFKETGIEYRAIEIEQKADDSWGFTGQEGGITEDTDAPYLAIVFEPEDIASEYYLIFLKNESVIGSGWFPYQSAVTIKRTLEGTLTTD
jgi:hypothetical protein